MSYKVNKSGTSVVKGLGDDADAEIDLDINQTAIVNVLRTVADLGVINLTKQLEIRHIYLSDAAIYSTLDKMAALDIVAKTTEPVVIESNKVNKVTWRLSDRFLNAMKTD